ncbi:hypothetical protein BS17DRAFT_341243 [Gyrodon lividus]|nr:hypothetical protein BS17DRAFT_341243 [Gyrodon lividus]
MPLHLAANNGHTKVVEFLLEPIASLPLDVIHFAIQNTRSPYQLILRMLAKKSADVNTLTNSGNSVLHTLRRWDSWSLQFEAFCLEAIHALVEAGYEQGFHSPPACDRQPFPDDRLVPSF